jgi:hypothetical protein
MKMKQNFVAWSADKEISLRRVLFVDALGVLLNAGLAIYSFPRKDGFWIGIFVAFWAVFFAWLFARDRGRLVAMLKNKPAGTGSLTPFIRLRPWQNEISCQCGASVHIANGKWFPNAIDAGGGRFCVVCPCGVGYFKLKEDRR